jgi:short-subunit dehydrogenase
MGASAGYWHDKVALVTGGSRGLGLAMAQSLAAAGAQVVLTARDPERLSAAAASIAAARRPCTWLPCDVTQTDQVDLMLEQVIRQQGRLDLLVNCAGQSARGAIAATTVEQFRDLSDLNFLSAVRCTRAALPHLLAARGHVVQIGSLAAKVASRYLGAYPASKFPLAAYAQQLRLELGPQGLHVLLVCPGPLRRDDAGTRYDAAAADLPAEARCPGGGVKLKGIDPAWLARRILVACEQREPELVIPWRARLLVAVGALWPRLGDWIILRMTGG